MTKIILGVTLHSKKETAEMLGVTTRSVQTYIEKGLLIGQKIGGAWYFTESNIVNFLNGRRSATTYDPAFKPKKK